MKNVIIGAALLTSSLAVFASEAGPGAYTPSSLTRSQVKAELAAAVRTGNIAAGGDTSLKLNQLYPQRYAAQPAMAGKTRAQVKAELAEAIRTGDIVVGDTSLKLNELYPQRYPAQPAVPGKTREQVKAELAEAIRTGDIVVGDVSLPLRQVYPQQHFTLSAGHTSESQSVAPQAATGTAGTVAR